MAHSLIIDNWLLQDIGKCLNHGLAAEETAEIAIDLKKRKHSIKNAPLAAIQIESLLSLIVDIVLRDNIFVDSKFINTWKSSRHSFSDLTSKGIIRPVNFLEHEDKLIEPRKIIVD